MTSPSDRVFPALLKYWRHRRGLSQLDLSLAAEVSAKHISFLETGRSGPSSEMVLLLAEVLDVPIRDRNELLRSAGLEAQYAEASVDELLTGPLLDAVQMMLDGHEPYPMVVVDRLYDIVLANVSGMALAAYFTNGDDARLNLLEVLFTPTADRTMISNWDAVAGTMLRRLHREVLHAPDDLERRALLDRLLDHPDAPVSWRTPDLSANDEPFVPVRLRLPTGEDLSFLSTITAFNAPQNVALDDLIIESWFPTDAATRAACERLFV